jgi:hypothetical protein
VNSEAGRKRLDHYGKSTCTYLMKLNGKEVIGNSSPSLLPSICLPMGPASISEKISEKL